MDNEITPESAHDAETTAPVPANQHRPEPAGADKPVLRTPADILAWVPYHLGFWPHESVVLMALHDERGSSAGAGLVARIDLAALGDPETIDVAGSQLETHLERDGASRALCLVYRDCSTTALMRQDAQVGTLLNWWLNTPWAAPERTFLIAEDTFCCLQCRTEPCCPPSGRPLEVLHDTAVAAHQVFHGHSYVPSRDALVPDPQVAEPRRRRVSKAAAEHFDSRPPDGTTALGLWRTSLLLLWDDLLAEQDPPLQDPPLEEPGLEDPPLEEPQLYRLPPRELREGEAGALEATTAAEMIAGLSDPIVRDAVLIDAGCPEHADITGLDDGAEQMLTGGFKPDPARVAAAERVLQELTGQADAAWNAPVLVARAWLAWWCADGARANILLDRALQAVPDHTLAVLLHTMLEHGAAPAWVKHPRNDAAA